jgi:dTDP-L-rhamnose 4-epimerase
MRILVTGGAGFIGSHTVDALLDEGHDVRVLDSLEPPVHDGDWPPYMPREVELVKGSVTDTEALSRALVGIDAVYHFAAYQDYMTDFSHFFSTNSVSTALMYELILREKLPVARVIVASSQAVYGEGKYVCPAHGDLSPDPRPLTQLKLGHWDLVCPRCAARIRPAGTDELRTSPHNGYALSKRDQEDIAIRLGRRYDIRSVALRYSIVQGPRQSFQNAYSGALRSFTVRVLTGQEPVVFEDGGQLRDYVSVHDVVAANLLVLRDHRADYQVVNVGGDRRVSVLELAELVIRRSGRSLEPQCPGLYRVGDPRHIVSDVEKLKSLGWRPAVGQEAMVDEYCDWAAKQPTLRDTFAEARAAMERLGVLQTAEAWRGANGQ